MTDAQGSSHQSYVISVSLYSGCYRHIRIAANATLASLHSAILAAFGFDDDHAHAFFMDNKLWSDHASYYLAGVVPGKRATKNFRLIQLGLEPGSKFKYVFDFGEEWAFDLRVLRLLDERTPSPRVVRSKGDSPAQYQAYEEDMNDEDEDEPLIDFPQTYPPSKIKALYKDLPLSKSTVSLLHSYFSAFINLYWIIPLGKALDIYNSQNPPISPDVFLQFADIVRHDKKPFLILGEDEIYLDHPGKVQQLERLIIHENLLIFDEDEIPEVQQKQHGKPFYVPPKEELLKYSDDDYHEQTPEWFALLDYLRINKRFSREKALDIAEEFFLYAYMGNRESMQYLHDEAERMGLQFRNMHEAEQFFQRFMAMSNATRMPTNRGHTPNELMASSGRPPTSITLKPGIKAAIQSGDLDIQALREEAGDMGFPTPEMQLSFLDELDRIQQEIDDEAAGKRPPDPSVPTSRNAPCPCGSGRKYKHCCGK